MASVMQGGFCVERCSLRTSKTPLHGGRMVRIDVLRIDLGIDCLGLHAGGVDGVTEFFGRFEEGYAFGGDVDLGAGLWISSGAGVALAGAEAPEAGNLNLVATFQSADDRFEERVYDDLSIAAGEVAQGGDFIYKVSFRHKWVPFVLGRAIRAGSNYSVVVDYRRDGDHLVNENSQMEKSLAFGMRCKKGEDRSDKK